MNLTNEQIAFYTENGYLKIENCLSEEEIKILQDEIPKTIEKDSPRVIFEDNGAVRSVFAPHAVNNIYNRLIKLKRFVTPAEQLIGSKVYLHQYKINIKKGLKGDWWEWHQDFPYWHIDDGIKKPDLISIMLYLQDTDAANGALLVIPKSHKEGIVKFAGKDSLEITEKQKYYNHHKTTDYLSSLNANIKFTVDHSLLKKIFLENGLITAEGKKGSALFFHGNIFHASNTNITPFDREAIIITYNSIRNLPENTQNPRPDFLAGRDYAAIEGIEMMIQ